MADPPPGEKSPMSRLLTPVKGLAPKIRRSPSPRPPEQPATGTQQFPPVSTITAMSLQSGNLAPQDNSYLAIGGPTGKGVDPKMRVHQAEGVGSVVYEGLKIVVKGLYDCSDMFLPLKTAAGGILTFIGLVETVLENKKELEDLKAKLEAILSIVEKYKKHGGLGVINHRIENFCQAITLQLETVNKLQKQSRSTRAALAKKDADTILKALRNINSLCDAFQIDTQLNIEVMVAKILEHLDSGEMNCLISVGLRGAHNTIGFIDKHNHEMTSYKTRTVGLISIVTRSQNLLDAFAVGSDGRVYTAAWKPGDSAFRGWWKIGRTDLEVPLCSTVTAVSRSANKLDVFVTGIDGRVYTAAWEPSNGRKERRGWRGWWPVANIKTQPGSPVSAVSRSANKLDVFVAGADGKVWTAAWEPSDDDNGFRGWWKVGDLNVPPAAPISVVSRSQDKLDVFATGIDGKVCTATWEPSDGRAGFRGWRHVAGGLAAPGAPVGVVSRSANKLDVFITGLNNRVWTAAWQPSDGGNGFRGWWQVGNLAVPPRTWISAVSRSTDKMDIFATGSDGRVYTAAWEPGDIRFRGWSWVASGQSSPGAPVGAVSRSTDKLDVILTGLDGRVWTAAWEPSDGSWSFRGWWSVGNLVTV